MKIIQIIQNILTQTEPKYVISLGLSLVFISVAFGLINWRKPRWRKLGNLVLFILLMRCLLLNNPCAWEWYNRTLGVDDIAWRQQSAVYVEYYKFFRYPGKKYLAVGSSQTYTMFHDYSQTHSDLTVFNLAGMTPLDLYLYREYIADRNPGYILLFLSEFDLAKEPSLLAAKIAPAQGWGLFRHWPVLSRLSKEAHTELALKEILIGEIFPEYKFSFVFKGLLQKFTQRNQALKIRSLYSDLHPDSQQLQRGIEGTLKEMDEKWIKYQGYFLEEFLRFCKERALKVVIVEGQYNPLVHDERTTRLNQLTVEKLLDLSDQYPFVTYVRRSQTIPLVVSDYEDTVHFKKESAERFVDDLLGKLDRELK